VVRERKPNASARKVSIQAPKVHYHKELLSGRLGSSSEDTAEGILGELNSPSRTARGDFEEWR
jgi:hypothetical protein